MTYAIGMCSKAITLSTVMLKRTKKCRKYIRNICSLEMINGFYLVTTHVGFGQMQVGGKLCELFLVLWHLFDHLREVPHLVGATSAGSGNLFLLQRQSVITIAFILPSSSLKILEAKSSLKDCFKKHQILQHPGEKLSHLPCQMIDSGALFGREE